MSNNEVVSLGEAYPIEQARCRHLLGVYRGLGNAGIFGLAHIEAVLQEADEAVVSGDLARMVVAYEEMVSCE